MSAASWSSSICRDGGLGGGTDCVSAISALLDPPLDAEKISSGLHYEVQLDSPAADALNSNYFKLIAFYARFMTI